MQNIKFNLLFILCIQSIILHSSQDILTFEQEQPKIIDLVMKNSLCLQDGFAFLQSQGLHIPSFHDFLKCAVSLENYEDFDMHTITSQAEDILATHLKDVFLNTLDDAIKHGKNLDQYQDHRFKYVMQHKNDYMASMVYLWLYQWGTTKNNDGQTPLHMAVSSNSIDIIGMFVEIGADVNIKDNLGETLLHWACRNDNCKKIVLMLIMASANLDAQDNDSCSPLHRAVDNDCKEIVKILIDAGADINLQDQNGWTSLYKAAIWNHPDIVQILLDAGAHLNVQDEIGRTPLHWIDDKNIVIVRMLIDAGADINVQENDGWTPLHCAAYENSAKIVCMLLDADADVNIHDDYDQTAQQLAHNHKMRAIFKEAEQKKLDTRAMAVFNNQIKKDWR